MGFKSKVLPRSLTDLNACVGFRTSNPQQGVKYQLLYLIFFMEGGLYKYPMKNILKTAKFLTTWGLSQRYCRVFNLFKCLDGFLHLKPTVGCQISTLIFEKKIMEGVLYKYPMKNILRRAKFLPTWGVNQRCFPGL